MLKESGSGRSTCSSDNISPGFGFKKISYNSKASGLSENIEEQSKLFGRNYTYKFDYSAIRQEFEVLAKNYDYIFKYQITPIGIYSIQLS